MGQPVEFQGANTLLRAPEGAENVCDLHTYRNGMCVVSCWEFSGDELAEIARTGRVYVSVLSGMTQHPIFVGDEEAVRSMVVDFGGVWAKGERG